MALLTLSTLVKIGLVVVATGASIATPVALTWNRNITPLVSHNVSDTSSNLVSDSATSPAKTKVVGNISNSDSLRSSSSSVQADTSGNTANVSTQNSSSQKGEFNKECFVIPADSSIGAKLLACLDVDSNKSNLERNLAELGHSFYLNDSNKNNVPQKIDGSLKWNPNGKQIIVQLEKGAEAQAAGNDGVFIVTGDDWSGIADKTKEVELLGDGCGLYRDNLRTFKNSEYLLVCGKDVDLLDEDNIKGIPLTKWIPNK